MTLAGVKPRAAGWVPTVDTLGARLALVRQAMGWNIAEAAKECGLPIASWRNWENRGKDPRGLLNVAMKIAGVTGVDYRWLALGPEDSAIPAASAPEPVARAITPDYPAPGFHVVAKISDPSQMQRDVSNIRSMRTRPIGR